MAAYTPYKDSPNSLEDEGDRISIYLERTSDNSAKIYWDIPVNLEDPNKLPINYNGILVLLDTKPITDKPKNQAFYTSDITVDENKHVGDVIGSSLVIGSFYNDKTTNSFIITDLQPNTNYYVAGFAADNVNNYHEGVFTYQLPLKLNKKGDDTAGYQIIELGVLETDPCDINNDLTIKIDDVEYTFNVTATNYKELVDDINYNFIQLDKTYMGDVPPNTNALYINNNTLYQYDGLKDNKIECFFNNVTPNNINIDSYWIHDNLYQWNNQWNKIDAFTYNKPINELTCNDVWFDGTNSYKWNNIVWKKVKTFLTETDPSISKKFKCNTVWFDNTNFYNYEYVDCKNKWNTLEVYSSDTNPFDYLSGYYWLNNNKIYQLINGAWSLTNINTNDTRPINGLWYNKKDNTVYQYNILSWDPLPINIITFKYDVTIPDSWYWFDTTNNQLFAWDELTSMWTNVNYTTSKTDPSISDVKTGNYWYRNNLMSYWDGSQWVDIDYFNSVNKPVLNTNDYWYNTIDKNYYQYDGTNWNLITGYTLPYDPAILQAGQYWFNTGTKTLYVWNGINWQSMMYSTTSLKPNNNDLWYDTSTNKLYEYQKKWIEIYPRATCELIDGNIKISSNTLGSSSSIIINEVNGTKYNLFDHTNPRGRYKLAVIGTDAVSEEPLYKQLGVGTDGSNDERRQLIDRILMMLGYPSIDIELDKSQLELCVELALAAFRKLSASAYERSVFFLTMMPDQQAYYMTDKKVGLNKIVEINAVYRRNNSALSTAFGNGIYSQQMLQWMYNPSMGMDLLSYYILSEYSELMEILFATRIVHRFNERTRRLDIYQNIGFEETVLVDCVIERTEQELITDRISSKWIFQWALAEAHVMLANIRGKYGSLPGAGGSVSLNAGEMQARADEMFERCRFEIDNFIANEPENIGFGSSIVIG